MDVRGGGEAHRRVPDRRVLRAGAASIARVYDYWLGGKDNFAIDREAGERLERMHGQIPALARENRAFLRRAVHHLAAECGIRQFVDVGPGLPTAENTHQVAQSAHPDARVVYVDRDPMVVAHARALLASRPGDPRPRVAALEGDARAPGEIAGCPELTALIRWDAPVAVVMTAVAHFLTGDELAEALPGWRRLLAPGSHLVVSHGLAGDEQTDDAVRLYRRLVAPVYPRTEKEILGLFDGFDLLPPGLVPVQRWRHRDPVTDLYPVLLAAVGRLEPW